MGAPGPTRKKPWPSIATSSGSLVDWNEPSVAFYDRLGAAAKSEWITRSLSGEALAALATSTDANADAAGAGDNPVISRGQYNGNQFQRNVFNQLEAYRSGRFAGIGHTLLVGGEYGRQTIDRLQYFGTTPSITLYNPVPDLAPTLSTTPTTNGRFWAQ